MTTTDVTTNTSSAVVGTADEFALGDMKMRTVGEQRVVVIRTPSGIHALDNACPHEGYGLATGGLDGELLTCQWHNWKFEASTGKCVMGEEDVACHAVDVADNGEVTVTVTQESDEELRSKLWPSLIRGFENDYTGQMIRDSLRLIETGVTPAEVMWAGFDIALPKNDWGPGHDLALAADCLTIASNRTGDDVIVPLMQGLTSLASETRDRNPRVLPAAADGIDLAAAIEREDSEAAMAATIALIDGGATPEEMQAALIENVSRHHLGYGHSIIYTQKSFEVLEVVGWDKAATLLPHLVMSITHETREDLLPYMRKAMRMIEAVDLGELANAPSDPAWIPDEAFVDILLDSAEAPIAEVVGAVVGGAGIDGLLNALSIGASRRLLRHDLNVEFDAAEPFQWLGITHVLTMTRAVRWAWRNNPGPASARLALFAAWLLHDSGRAERRHGVLPEVQIEPQDGDIAAAVRTKDVASVLGTVRTLGPERAGPILIDAALDDPSGAFIVLAHLVKLTWAAIEESEATGSDLPLLAAARYLAAPRSEGFMGGNVTASLAFVQSGQPPRR